MVSRKTPARKRKLIKRKQVRGHHPPHLKVQARELYLYTASTMIEIADLVKVPEGTIRSWYFQDKWPEARRILEKELQERSDFEAAQIIHENRNKVMRRHLQVGEKLENQIEKRVDDANNRDSLLETNQLLDLSRAFLSSGNVTSRVVGLDKASHIGEGGGIKILINTTGTPTPIPPNPEPLHREPIDVQPEETSSGDGDPF